MKILIRTAWVICAGIATGALIGCAAKVDNSAIIQAAEAPACASSSISCQELAGYYPSIKTVSSTEAIVAFYKTHEDATDGEPPAAAATVVKESDGSWKPK